MELAWKSPRNNTIDLFEIYFQEEEPDHMPEILNLKTIALFKDREEMGWKINNTVFFGGEEHFKKLGKPYALMVYFSNKDPSDEARSVTKIGWHPEGPTKLVGSYSNLRFQRILSVHQWEFLNGTLVIRSSWLSTSGNSGRLF